MRTPTATRAGQANGARARACAHAHPFATTSMLFLKKPWGHVIVS